VKTKILRLTVSFIALLFLFPAAPSLTAVKSDGWNLASVKKDIVALSKTIGVRAAGTLGERRGSNYIVERLKSAGYTPRRQAFKISNSATSSNIITEKKGQIPSQKFIIGAHYDTKSPSPGANDNGTGTAILLEMARLFKNRSVKPTIIFVFFGAEEKVGSNSNNHHFGSRNFVKRMTPNFKKQTTGMISVDMVGYGTSFHVRSMRKGTMKLVNSLLNFAKGKSYPLSYLKDPGPTGWSDHEAFELAGIPSAWLEWRDDPTYHSKRDTFEHIQWNKVDTTGKFLFSYLSRRL